MDVASNGDIEWTWHPMVTSNGRAISLHTSNGRAISSRTLQAIFNDEGVQIGTKLDFEAVFPFYLKCVKAIVKDLRPLRTFTTVSFRELFTEIDARVTPPGTETLIKIINALHEMADEKLRGRMQKTLKEMRAVGLASLGWQFDTAKDRQRKVTYVNVNVTFIWKNAIGELVFQEWALAFEQFPSITKCAPDILAFLDSLRAKYGSKLTSVHPCACSARQPRAGARSLRGNV